MSEPTKPESKHRLGDFEIAREIGRGGMGIVYEARQVSLNRKVALKVLSAGLGLTSTAVVRFRREAEAAAKLHHTNIVPIYATGEEDGTHYYAMELIEGPSLNVVIRQTRSGETLAESRTSSRTETQTSTVTALPAWLAETFAQQAPTGQSDAPESTVSDSSTTLTTSTGYFDTIARMIGEVADALDYAHDQGVMHRDIKPSNLLLSPAGRLSINDFGLARMLEQPGMTTTGEFVGSPLYMSPEQITAGRAPLDHRTDIYSLGATLYELLTLQPPFPGERRDQVIAQIIHKEPKPLRRLNRKVPVDLETICLKAMEKDPDRRYQTAGQMAEDLRRFVNRFAISAKRAGPITRTVKWVRRRPALAATIIVALLAAGAAGLFAYSAYVSNQRMIALQRQDALDDALLAAMSGDFEAAEAAIEQAEMLGASAGWVRMLRGQVALHQSRVQEAIRHLEQAVRLLPDNVAARSLLALACVDAWEVDRYYSLLEELDRLQPVTPEDYLFKGMAESYVHPDRGLNTLDEAIRRRDSSVARVIRAQARTMRAMDTADPDDMDAALEDAAVAKSMLPDNPMVLCVRVQAHLVAANVFADAHQEARREASLAKAERDAQALERFVGFPLPHAARAWYFEHVGQDDAALSEWRRAGEADASGRTAREYARALYYRGKFEEALRFVDRADERGKNVYFRADRAIILAELPDGPARALAAYYEAAQVDLEGTIALRPQSILRLLGRKSEAIEASRQVREAFSRMPRWALEWYQHELDYNCGLISAEELLEAAGESRWNQCEAYFDIALTLLADGDRAGAAEHFQKAIDTHVFVYFEHRWGRAFLARLKQDPTWPPWIPVRQDSATQPADEPGEHDIEKEDS